MKITMTQWYSEWSKYTNPVIIHRNLVTLLEITVTRRKVVRRKKTKTTTQHNFHEKIKVSAECASEE